MSAQLQIALDVARSLSPREKAQLIEAVARSLAQDDPLNAASSAFLRGRSLDDLIAEQQPPVVTNLDALAADFWPADETADDVIAFVEAQRRADQERA